MKEMSRKLGFNDCYLNNVLSRGKIASYGMNLLETLYGISYESIKPDENLPGDAVENTSPTVETEDNGLQKFIDDMRVTVTIDYNELQQAIYSAVIGALRKLVRDGDL